VKHLKTVFNALRWGFLTFITGFSAPVAAQDDSTLLAMDSVEISLLTCQPHDEVYSLYGHTAIRYHDFHKKGKVDAAFNYGVFNFHAPHFVARFVFGLTDYELGAFPYHLFQAEYRHFGSMVTEQVLNLTAQEKYQLRQALSENLRPENCVYRYNYFYNNCTTKARDIIERCINGKVEYAEREDYTPTYREMIHEMTQRNPWSRFGNDLLLGIKADQPTILRQQEFLPQNLMYDFDRARINDNGTRRPLVKERRVSVPPGVQMHESGFPLSPLVCFSILLVIGIIIFLIEWKMQSIFIVWDVLLMLATGIIGIVLTLMLFSQHPTVSLNLQIILFNPLPWLFLWPVIRKKKTIYWHLTAILSILFLIGALFQSYAEGIWSLALCLLLQCCLHLWHKTK
jgi:hypothetical protein